MTDLPLPLGETIGGIETAPEPLNLIDRILIENRTSETLVEERKKAT